MAKFSKGDTIEHIHTQDRLSVSDLDSEMYCCEVVHLENPSGHVLHKGQTLDLDIDECDDFFQVVSDNSTDIYPDWEDDDE